VLVCQCGPFAILKPKKKRELANQLFGLSFYCLDRAPAGGAGKNRKTENRKLSTLLLCHMWVMSLIFFY
jgi:hypothetical protein